MASLVFYVLYQSDIFNETQQASHFHHISPDKKCYLILTCRFLHIKLSSPYDLLFQTNRFLIHQFFMIWKLLLVLSSLVAIQCINLKLNNRFLLTNLVKFFLLFQIQIFNYPLTRLYFRLAYYLVEVVYSIGKEVYRKKITNHLLDS